MKLESKKLCCAAAVGTREMDTEDLQFQVEPDLDVVVRNLSQGN